MEPARTYWAYLARLLIFVAVVAGIVLLVWYIVSLADDDEPVVNGGENEAIEMVGEAIEESTVVEEGIENQEPDTSVPAEPEPAPPEDTGAVAGTQETPESESLPNTGVGSFAIYVIVTTVLAVAALFYRQSRSQLKQSLLE